MRILLFVLLTFPLGINKGYTQNVKIVPGEAELNYLLSKPGGNSLTTQTVKIKVEYSASVKPANDVVVNFQVSNVSNAALGPTIVNIPVGGFSIDNDDFKAKPDTIEFTVSVTLNAIPKLTASEFFDIGIRGAGSNDPKFRGVITTLSTADAEKKKKEKDDNIYETGAISIGHSFDFFGKSNALISYADGFIFKPNSIRIGKNAPAYKYGFAVKIYQNKSITIDSLNTSGAADKFINQSLLNPFQPPVNDSVLVKQEILNRKASYSASNWGMSLRLFRDISYINEKVKFYLGLHGEFLRRDIKTNYEYKAERDTVINVKTSQLAFQTLPLERKTVQSEFYAAAFIGFLYADDDVKIHFTLVPAGLNIYRYSTTGNKTDKKCFFLGQFDLIVKKINVKLGAECRGLFHVNAQPYWNVFISKSFSWDKISELFFEK